MSGDHLRDMDYDGPCAFQKAEERITELETKLETSIAYGKEQKRKRKEDRAKLAKAEAENAELREAGVALLDDIGDTYDESSGYHRVRVWVDGDLIDELATLLAPTNDSKEGG